MAPSLALNEKTSTPTELQKVVSPCSVTAEDANEDAELYIFRIPRGLIHINDLKNLELKLGGKKTSKINIKNKTYELISKPMKDGTPMLPWFPDSNGALVPVTQELSITEVSIRRCFDAENMPAASEDLEYLRPVQRIPPDLPRRDFFSGYNCLFAGPPMPPKTTSPKKTPKTSVPESKKSRLSLEDITPQDSFKKPVKRKKVDSLAANFQNIFNDICSLPANESVNNNSVTTSPSQSKKKSKKPDAGKKVKQEALSDEVELDSEILHVRSSETPDGETKRKGKKVKVEVLENDDVQPEISSSASPYTEKKKKKKKRKRDDD